MGASMFISMFIACLSCVMAEDSGGCSGYHTRILRFVNSTGCRKFVLKILRFDNGDRVSEIIESYVMLAAGRR